MRLVLALMLVSGLRAAAEPKTAAQLLRQADQAADEFEFAKGLDLARRALEAGTAGPELVWHVHQSLAQMAASAGYADAAVDSFTRALELHPTLELPAHASPRLTGPFQKARERNSGARLRARAQSSRGFDGSVTTRVDVQDDHEHLVEGGRLFLREGAQLRSVKLAWAEGLNVAWPCPTETCQYYVALVDAYGNELLWLGSPTELLSTEAVAAKIPPPVAAWVRTTPTATTVALKPLPGGFRRAWPWMAAGVVVAGVAGYFAVRTVGEDSRFKSTLQNRGTARFQEAQHLDAARQRDDLVAWSCAGGAAALGAVAAFRW